MTTEEILAAALKLDQKERAELAGRLIQSLDKEEENLSREEWEKLWAEEADRRIRELDDGKVKAIPAEKVFADAHRILSKT
jgi:putative addiction module component (TIGR02574 family)